MLFRPTNALVGAACVVAATTLALPNVTVIRDSPRSACGLQRMGNTGVGDIWILCGYSSPGLVVRSGRHEPDGLSRSRSIDLVSIPKAVAVDMLLGNAGMVRVLRGFALLVVPRNRRTVGVSALKKTVNGFVRVLPKIRDTPRYPLTPNPLKTQNTILRETLSSTFRF